MSAKYEYRRSVTHRCGHRELHTFYARCRQEADSWAFNLKKSECSQCREKTQLIAQEAKAANLPILIGSTNQIPWATAIRQRIFNILSKSDKHQREALFCRYEKRASWWIDNRHGNVEEIVSHLSSIGRRAA